MELLQQVRIIDPTQQVDQVADVLIIEGKIKAIAERITDYPTQTSIIKESGLVLGTGLVDLYSHSGEPGNESRETLLNIAQAAAAGGFTQIGILPDTVPLIDNLEVLTAVRQKSNYLNSSSQDSRPKLHFWGASYDAANQQMTELGELKPGIIGFASHHNLGSLNTWKQILEYVQPWQKTIAIALDQNELVGDGVIRDGEVSIRYGMSGNPSFSEAAILAAVLEIVAEIPTPVHIMRVSTKRGVELIAEAKARGIPVTASTTWMHLLCNSEAIGSYDTNFRLEPPLGNKPDQLALINGVKQGIIDAIAIDHQAYTYEEKTVAFALAPPGVVGLEIALPLLWQRFVKSGEWSAIELWQALSSRPRQCVQQTSVAISPGQAADLVLFDPQQTWTANQDNLMSPATNTPWYDQEITGKVIKIWNSYQ
ncbi:MAG: dihydroorotase [Waterburya sp.]